MTLRTDVSALYVDPRGPYPKLVADWWDEKRDARLYAGPNPVVAHPPCGPWGQLRHLYSGDDKDCAVFAVAHVRRFGGVLEHPRQSMLWREPLRGYDGVTAFLPMPADSFPDPWGGFTVEVEQVAWGHVARKTTWLYFVGVTRAAVQAGVRTGGTPTHWLSGGRTKSSRSGSPVPPGIKVCSAQQRRRTPVAFAEWLIGLASQARPFFLAQNTERASVAASHRDLHPQRGAGDT